MSVCGRVYSPLICDTPQPLSYMGLTLNHNLSDVVARSHANDVPQVLCIPNLNTTKSNLNQSTT